MSKSEQSKVVVVLLGPPGAGKGTQAAGISQKFQLPHISTGDLLRDNIRRKTELGTKVKHLLDAGQFVDDTTVLTMVHERTSQPDCSKGFILDGCPRTVVQAERLDEQLTDYKFVALNLDVPDQEIVRRIQERMVCEICNTPYDSVIHPPKTPGICDLDGGKLVKRRDDNVEVVKERLLIYHRETAPLQDYYKKSGRLHDIDGSVGKDAIAKSIQHTLEQALTA